MFTTSLTKVDKGTVLNVQLILQLFGLMMENKLNLNFYNFCANILDLAPEIIYCKNKWKKMLDFIMWTSPW